MAIQDGQGGNAHLILQWSDDFGRTWSNERTAEIGKVGEYKARCKFHRLGMARDRVYRVMITDPVKRVILSAELDAVGGSN